VLHHSSKNLPVDYLERRNDKLNRQSRGNGPTKKVCLKIFASNSRSKKSSRTENRGFFDHMLKKFIELFPPSYFLLLVEAAMLVRGGDVSVITKAAMLV
jgi:hypothetical protein